jgi:hypothetical protein
MYLIRGRCFGKCRRGIFATNYSLISNVVEGKRVHDAGGGPGGRQTFRICCVWGGGSGIGFTNMLTGAGGITHWWHGRICQFTGASTSVWSVSQLDQFSRNEREREREVCSLRLLGLLQGKSAIHTGPQPPSKSLPLTIHVPLQFSVEAILPFHLKDHR